MYFSRFVFSERLEEEQRATEELYEKRVDILCRSVKKTRKRARIERSEGGDDDRDDDIASVVSRRYKSRIEVISCIVCKYLIACRTVVVYRLLTFI